LTNLQNGIIPWSEKTSDFSDKEADKFLERFEVLDQFSNTDGFSATLFRNKANGQLYFVNRGTNDAPDFVTDAILATGGKPLNQILSMVNYYLRLQAGTSHMAQQVVAMYDEDGALSFEFSTPVAGVGTVNGIGNGPVEVCGHSLGGYLSTIFGYLFGGNVLSVNTYNAPGSWGVEATMRELASLLGNSTPSYAEDRQTNLIGDYLVSAVPGHRGTDIRVFEEGNAHSQKVMTDSLALQNMLASLDPTLSPANMLAIVKAASAVDGNSLEQTLDSIRKTILGPGTIPTKASGASDSQASRETYYKNLYDFMGTGQFTSLQGKIMISTAYDTIDSRARTEFSTLLSIINLSPIMITGTSTSNQTLLDSKLQTVWSDLYSKWQADNQLTAAERAAGKANFSDQYLKDRASMLAWLIKGNIGDKRDLSGEMTITDNSIAGDWIFTDVDGKHRINVEHSTSSEIEDEFRNQVHFSSATKSDNFTGGSVSDFIYCGGGNDTICADNYAAATAGRCAA
ncbi:MAG TPA: hypothetical protein PL053_08020, partial [Deltaproteobacteria bacterium]|nr:hypothetical protein [Deltaproteobacteria bacterium]